MRPRSPSKTLPGFDCSFGESQGLRENVCWVLAANILLDSLRPLRASGRAAPSSSIARFLHNKYKRTERTERTFILDRACTDE